MRQRVELISFAGMNASPQADASYRKLVRTVRILIVLPLAAATVALFVQLIAGPGAEAAGRWASFVVASGALTAGATLVLAQMTLRDRRREAGGPDDLWVSEELALFARDLIGYPMRTQKPQGQPHRE